MSIFSNSLLNDTVIYTNSSNMRLGNTANAVAPLNITSNAVYTSNVNMGINNSNPQYSLDVVGSSRISGNLYLQNGKYSNSTNGYTVLPGGLLMQWGQFSFTTNYYGGYVNFNIAFSSAPYSVTATLSDPSWGGPFNSGYQTGIGVNTFTTTNFTLYVKNWTLVSSASLTLYWMAIGPN